MNRRYLTRLDAERALAAGRPVEHWLGLARSELGSIVRWVACTKTSDVSFAVTLYEMFDASIEGLFDVYAFQAVEECPSIVSFESPTLALDYAIRELHADGTHFVNGGVVQDEYRDARAGAVEQK